MTQSTMTVLESTKTGPIAFVWNGVFASVQFNCNCLDAVHLCHGMCCRNRTGYSVLLDEDELEFYQHTVHHATGEAVLAVKEDRSSCIYFDDDKGLCTIYQQRPRMCRQWHCSPRGSMIDVEIIKRDAGWMLTPVRKEESDFMLLRRDENNGSR